MLVFGDLQPEDVFDLVTAMCDFILQYTDATPCAFPEQCGNYLEHNLRLAQYYAAKYQTALLQDRRMTYPEN